MLCMHGYTYIYMCLIHIYYLFTVIYNKLGKISICFPFSALCEFLLYNYSLCFLQFPLFPLGVLTLELNFLVT